MATGDEKVVMTPHKQGNVTTIQVERVKYLDKKMVVHEGSGQHKNLVINKEDRATSDTSPPEMQLEFTCVMHNKRTGDTSAENRRLKFWFVEGIQQLHRLDSSYEFFKELINPETFPRDYVGFIKKVMKQLQAGRYTRLRRVDVDLITLDKKDQDALVPERDMRPVELIVRENIQARLEEAYPNVLTMDDLIRILEVTETVVTVQIDELIARDIIQEIMMEGKLKGQKGYRRKVQRHNDEEVTELKGAGNAFSQVSQAEKPTIAIITNLLCEKLAVDAMMEHKTTFVRYKTEGESHVYTIGYIGPHKVISTKLPMVGRELQAKISAGNTTTRLLGAFQSLEHVLVVGVGGSVPHVYEFEKHSRLGDIVVSAPPPEDNKGHMYIYCERVVEPDEDAPADTPIKFVLKKYSPADLLLQRCVEAVLDRYESAPSDCQWDQCIRDGIEGLSYQDMPFERPPSDTDKLKFKMGEGCSFDIKHPDVPQSLAHLYREGVPAVRLGCIGSGRPVTDNDLLRDTFAMEHQLLAYDSEYDQVLESIIGNRVNSYIFIRGIADYVEGGHGAQWQPYAALAAASFMKAVCLQLPKAE